MDKEEKMEAPPKAPKPEKPVAVRIIRDNGLAALVEWQVRLTGGQQNDVRRAYVPKGVIQHLDSSSGTGGVVPSELDAGTAYGVAWEELAVVTATPQEIGRQLRRHGIWTRRDLEQHIDVVQAAYLEAYGADLGVLLQKVRQQEE
jgi:hypothetical protein